MPKEPKRPRAAVIEVCERAGGYVSDHATYHAQIKGHPGYWGCGRSIDEAIGSLVRCHPPSFGITTEYLGKLAR